MTVPAEIEHVVRERAAGRCEYCRMHQSLQGATFHVEHALPRSRSGSSTIDNLGLACPRCNLLKSDRTEFPDPETNELVKLYNPRTDVWIEHFRWEEYTIVPISSIGRVTMECLELNHERRLRIRHAESLFDLFPPEEQSRSD